MIETHAFTLDLLGLPVRVVFTANVGPGLHRFDYHSDIAPSPFSLIGHRIHIAFHEAVQARGIEQYAMDWIEEQSAHRLAKPVRHAGQ